MLLLLTFLLLLLLLLLVLLVLLGVTHFCVIKFSLKFSTSHSATRLCYFAIFRTISVYGKMFPQHFLSRAQRRNFLIFVNGSNYTLLDTSRAHRRAAPAKSCVFTDQSFANN